MPCAFNSRAREASIGRPPFVDASSRGLGDPLQLALPAKVHLELREHAQHVQEALAGRRAGVDRLLRGPRDCPARPDSADDVLEVSDAPSETIDGARIPARCEAPRGPRKGEAAE
jgi:hypothetical protein